LLVGGEAAEQACLDAVPGAGHLRLDPSAKELAGQFKDAAHAAAAEAGKALASA